jgi:hypothetical protein
MTDAVDVEVRRSGKRFEASAVLDLAADERTVWQTITDYPALPRFMPGIRACRVLERSALEADGEQLVVEQKGVFKMLLFAQSMDVLLDIEHRPMKMAEAKARSFLLGPLKTRALDAFEGRYDLVARTARGKPPRVELRYTALIALRVTPPPAVGSVAVRQNLAAQLTAVAQEVARRMAAPARPAR